MALENITVLVSVVSGAIGLIALTVTYSQMRIASAKTKLDLYNRRFDIYTAALNYHRVAWHGNYDEIEECGQLAVRFFRESRFLFNPKDEIFPMLQRFMQQGAFVRKHAKFEKEVRAGNRVVDESFRISHEKSTESLLELGNILKEIEDKLMSYLSFHNVRGWTFF